MASPPTLRGQLVHLVPLQLAHASALERAAAVDPDTFAFMSSSPLDAGGKAYVEAALAGQRRGELLPFAVADADSGTVVGSTRFGDLGSGHPRCEIGWTWLVPSHRGGRVNAEMKLLMLEHAFTALGCERAAIKTDGRNVRAQRAIARLGATLEGTLRKHMLARDGFVRDTVYYSVIREEWPAVRQHLEQLVAGRP